LAHQPPDGGQLGYSHGGSSPKGDLPKRSPFNPHVGSFKWLAPDLRMFIPPRYQAPPTYIKDIDLDAHIKVFNKAIKANGQTMETDFINLLGFTLKDNIFQRGKHYVQQSKLHF
jgi:hypothetical protein